LTFNGLHGVIAQEGRTFHNHHCGNLKSSVKVANPWEEEEETEEEKRTKRRRNEG
jgi:hypothetical protein